jgi:hypothetical protein
MDFRVLKLMNDGVINIVVKRRFGAPTIIKLQSFVVTDIHEFMSAAPGELRKNIKYPN